MTTKAEEEEAAEANGFDRFDYGSVGMKAFKNGSVVDVNGEIVWLEFDSNPAVFANMIRAEQRFEDFFVDGVEELKKQNPYSSCFDDAAEIAAYLRGARVPGVTTRVEVETVLFGPGNCWLLQNGFVVDPPLPPFPLPGPESAGCYGARSRGGRSFMTARQLCAPGLRKVELNVAVNGPKVQSNYTNHIARTSFVGDVEVKPGKNVLRFAVEGPWPDVVVRRLS